MKLDEIHVLNRALDGKDIYALPSLAAPLTDFVAESVKDRLVRKRILRTHKSLTDYGLELAYKIHLYKKARKYMATGHIAVGFIDKCNGVALIHNKYFDSYSFDFIHTNDVAASITEAYPFLLRQAEPAGGGNPPKITGIESARARCRVEAKDKLILMTKCGRTETREEIFYFDKRFYLFDCNGMTLSEKNADDLRELLKDRMGISDDIPIR